MPSRSPRSWPATTWQLSASLHLERESTEGDPALGHGRLWRQRAPGGALVRPLAEGGSHGSLFGTASQRLHLIEKDLHGMASKRDVLPVAFVPLIETFERAIHP